MKKLQVEMKKIEYTVDDEDIGVFGHYHALQQPGYRDSLSRHKYIWPGMMLIAAAYTFVYGQSTDRAILVSVIALLWGYFIPRMLKRINTKGALRKSLDQNHNILGKHILSIESGSLVDNCNSHVSRINWENILRIENNETHAFIYTDQEAALIIPKHSISQGDYEKFIERVNKSIR